MKNIGRVAEADIEINGIAVIAGENGTGKSTVGKGTADDFLDRYAALPLEWV